jgi:CII-binding regulator of phage lambda lysogenization HflD
VQKVLQVIAASVFRVDIEAAGMSETLERIYQDTLSHIAEDINLYIHHLSQP